MWALDALAVGVTYARLPHEQLYHVSHDGLAGGASRALVLLNFPIALVAIALALVAVPALPRRAWLLTLPAIALCEVVAWPGVVDQADLDAKPVNALPAAGVALALGLTAAATVRAGARLAAFRRGDVLRAAVVLALFALSLPWLAAELGFSLPGAVFLSGKEVTLHGETLPAVHRGHHHGLDGALLAVTAITLSRVRHRSSVLSVYASVMLAYGLVNAAQDFWLEQVVKRGWTTWEIPSALHPGLTSVWGVMLAGAGVAYALGFARSYHAEGV